jgi:hypothetical protein
MIELEVSLKKTLKAEIELKTFYFRTKNIKRYSGKGYKLKQIKGINYEFTKQ